MVPLIAPMEPGNRSLTFPAPPPMHTEHHEDSLTPALTSSIEKPGDFMQTESRQLLCIYLMYNLSARMYYVK